MAEPGVIGLSAIAAAVTPVGRDDPSGRYLALGPSGRTVLAAIAPGLVRPVGIVDSARLDPDTPWPMRSTSGVLALDGEREMVLSRQDDPPVITLSLRGPMVIDVPTVMRLAAERRLFDV
jgi:hypothetical protein